MVKHTQMFKCPCCHPILKEFSTRNGMLVHVKNSHPERYEEVREIFWETPENRFPCDFCKKLFSGSARRHERTCKENPNRAQTPAYKPLLEEFLEKVGRWACGIGRAGQTISEKTWGTYKSFIRRIICASEAQNPGHLINFDSLEFSQLVNIDDYVSTQTNLSPSLEAQLINAYMKLVRYIIAELDLKINVLGNNVLRLNEIMRYLTDCLSKATVRLKTTKKKIPLDKEQRNHEKQTVGGARGGSYTALDFENCDRIFSNYLNSARREQILLWFEENGFTVNPALGINSERDIRHFMAGDFFFHGIGARIGAVTNLTYEALRRYVDHGEWFELRVFNFKTARTFGHTPFIYPRREFNLLRAYAEAFPLARTGGPNNREGLLFADSDGRQMTNHYPIMRQILLCTPDVELPSNHRLVPQDYRHYIATLTLATADQRLINAGARSATHSLQMHQQYQHPEVAAADYLQILELVNERREKRRKRIILPSSSSSSSSSEEQQQQPQEQPPNPQQQHQQQPPDPHQQLAAQLVAHMRRTGHLREPAGNAAAVSAVVESAAGSSSSSSSEEPMPPAPFTIGNPNPNACTVTVPGGQFLGDYYDCVDCDLEEVCPVCIEGCHAECAIKSLQDFGFYRCQCGEQGVPSCNNLLPHINRSISSKE